MLQSTNIPIIKNQLGHEDFRFLQTLNNEEKNVNKLRAV